MKGMCVHRLSCSFEQLQTGDQPCSAVKVPVPAKEHQGPGSGARAPPLGPAATSESLFDYALLHEQLAKLLLLDRMIRDRIHESESTNGQS